MVEGILTGGGGVSTLVSVEQMVCGRGLVPG